MAFIKKFKKEKTISKRSNNFTEKFSIQVNSVKSFYRLVSVLNSECGHENWTTQGRPLRHLRKVERFNRFVEYNRAHEVVFCVPDEYKSLSTRLSLLQ